MANFENGLPSQDINLEDKKVNSVNYQSKKFNEISDNKDIVSVSYQKNNATESANIGINAASYQAVNPGRTSMIGVQSVSYQTEKVEGNNTVLFYL